MRMARRTLLLIGFALALAGVSAAAENPYRQPLKAKGFSARAVVLPARSVGRTVMRAESALAVEIRIQVEDYFPRALEPTLFIDGKPVRAASGIAGVQGRITTLSFVIEEPGPLKDNATLALQMGDDKRTRSPVPGRLRRHQIHPLEQAETERAKLPTLQQWLRQPKPAAE